MTPENATQLALLADINVRLATQVATLQQILRTLNAAPLTEDHRRALLTELAATKLAVQRIQALLGWMER